MTGNNTMELNQAVIIEAVQMYLDSRFKEGLAPKVISVEKSTSGKYSSSDWFTVLIEEKPA